MKGGDDKIMGTHLRKAPTNWRTITILAMVVLAKGKSSALEGVRKPEKETVQSIHGSTESKKVEPRYQAKRAKINHNDGRTEGMISKIDKQAHKRLIADFTRHILETVGWFGQYWLGRHVAGYRTPPNARRSALMLSVLILAKRPLRSATKKASYCAVVKDSKSNTSKQPSRSKLDTSS